MKMGKVAKISQFLKMQIEENQDITRVLFQEKWLKLASFKEAI